MQLKRQLAAIAIGVGIALTGCSSVQNDIASAPPLPQANAPTHHGVLYIASHNRFDGTYYSLVDIFPLTGPNQKQTGSITSGLNIPSELSVDSKDALYVANSGNGTVTVYPHGSSVPSMTYSKMMEHPLDAIADSSGHVFVSGFDVVGKYRDERGHIVEFNAGTNVPIASKQLGTAREGMAEDAHGNLYVAYLFSNYDASIAEFGPGLTNERRLGMTLNQPQGLLLDRAGNIVVTESAPPCVEVFRPKSTKPSVTVHVSSYYYGYGGLVGLAMQKDEKTLWVSNGFGDVYAMPYPLTPQTVPIDYETISTFSSGIAVSNG